MIHHKLLHLFYSFLHSIFFFGFSFILFTQSHPLFNECNVEMKYCECDTAGALSLHIHPGETARAATQSDRSQPALVSKQIGPPQLTGSRLVLQQTANSGWQTSLDSGRALSLTCDGRQSMLWRGRSFGSILIGCVTLIARCRVHRHLTRGRAVTD